MLAAGLMAEEAIDNVRFHNVFTMALEYSMLPSFRTQPIARQEVSMSGRVQLLVSPPQLHCVLLLLQARAGMSQQQCGKLQAALNRALHASLADSDNCHLAVSNAYHLTLCSSN